MSKNKHAWLDDALEFGKSNESFVALSPRDNPQSWAAWRNYFRWLNWAPARFINVEIKHAIAHDSPATWTAPIAHPDQFTRQFRPADRITPKFPLEIKPVKYSIRPTLDALRVKYGPNWGLSEAPDPQKYPQRGPPPPPKWSVQPEQLKPFAAADVPATPQLSNLMKAFLGQDPAK